MNRFCNIPICCLPCTADPAHPRPQDLLDIQKIAELTHPGAILNAEIPWDVLRALRVTKRREEN